MFIPRSLFFAVLVAACSSAGARAQYAPAQTPYAPGTLTGSWTDASLSATTTAVQALPAVSLRSSLQVLNVGSTLACLNFTNAAAFTGSACSAGSIPLPAGGGILYDQPGFVSTELVSVICVTGTCPLTIKVH